MITPVDIDEIFTHLESEERVSALKHIVDRFSCNSSQTDCWDCRWKGVLYDVRFFRNEKYCYAIIPNKKWLLWYFRKPALSMFPPNFDKLRDDFPPQHINGKTCNKVEKNPAGEITVKLFGMRDARLLTEEYLK